MNVNGVDFNYYNDQYVWTTMFRFSTVLLLLLAVEGFMVSAYFISGDGNEYNRNLARLLYYTRKSCIKRGNSCDERPNDCCFHSSCRCNLWGTNCRCMRRGLFQG
ncbi:U8-agatoxin-Ao1a-like isoform X2 [Tachypleus tridentatus]|uniref:U8-agatoxin-Ao1a-like isoform X2 n=1 Tax=Tachypleus tridentatus TaxID=6853 RepID=UPI003FD0D677